MAARILIADDNVDMIDGLSWYLEAAGFEVHSANTGKQALDKFATVNPDVVILDIMMPEIDGVTVCETIRRESDAYIIMLSAREGEIDKVRALDKGADDYVTKPFSAAEVVSRINALLRRSTHAPASTATYHWKGLEVFVEEHRVRVHGCDVTLTMLEFELLATLMRRARTVFSRNQLIDIVWGDSGYDGGLRLVDNQVYRLREKLVSAGLTNCPIVTIRGVGYAFRPED
ncbi:MAG: response regulator transcription factor [bacterium]